MKKFIKKLLTVLVALTVVSAPVEVFARAKVVATTKHAQKAKSEKVASKKLEKTHKIASRATAKGSFIKTKFVVNSRNASGRNSKMLVSLRKPQSAVRHWAEPSEDEDTQYLDNVENDGILRVASNKAMVFNQDTGKTLYAKGISYTTPIASVTKLMTAMVMLDAGLPMDELLTISDEDVDYLKNSSSRVPVGTELSREEILQLALMASENRAASALSRYYPGGKSKFVMAMNAKAASLGMTSSRFVDPTGLDSNNVSTAEDLVKMVNAAYQYEDIRKVTTTPSYEVTLPNHEYPVSFNNTNGLVRGGEWEIGLSKTGYISEAGRCLVMQATIAGHSVIVVLLDSVGKSTRLADASRIRKWIENNSPTVTGQLAAGKDS